MTVSGRLNRGRTPRGPNVRGPNIRASAGVLLLALAWTGAGCKTTTSSGGGPQAAEDVARVESFSLVVKSEDGTPQATLGADYYVPSERSKSGATDGVAVVIVPGAGRVSKKGERSGNGTRDYPAPIETTVRFAESFAAAGLHVLAYDKRTCTPSDVDSCNDNPRTDIDEQGPRAMSKDVDAACEVLTERGHKVVLFAHGQAAQIALSSQCATNAAAIVLVGPMPDAVDKVIVAGLNRRATLLRQWGDKEAKSTNEKTRAAGEEKIKESLAIKNRAANLGDTFALIRAGKFAADARVLGASPRFWTGWMELTAKTPEMVKKMSAPVVVALGQWDSQYAPADKRKIEKLATTPAQFVVVDKADHYLMRDTQFDQQAHTRLVNAVLEALLGPATPNT